MISEVCDISVIGCRVKVPFGRQQKIGLILEVTKTSTIPKSKIKKCTEIIDEKPIFSEATLWLVSFASRYYLHPIGRVVAAAMPSHLRKGKPTVNFIEKLHLTNKGKVIKAESIIKNAPKQAALINYLQKKGPVTVDILDDLSIDWRVQKNSLSNKGWIKVTKVPSSNDESPILSRPTKGPNLNSEQKKAVNIINNSQEFQTFLVDGVTGSGKTEVYLQLILNVIKKNKQCLILVPEIGLTSQFIKRIIARIGIKPAMIHSALTERERFTAWQAIKNSKSNLILGTRSAIFAPTENLGIIIVDEENDVSYKQQDGFRYSARDLAIAKGSYHNIPVVLGSATPSIESLYRCTQKKYKRLVLEKRAGRAKLPSMHLIDVTKEYMPDGLSQKLIKIIKKHLKNNGQVLIYINRRGFAPTLICKSCNHVAQCPRCDSRMTVYQSKKLLTCHHCGSSRSYTHECNLCGAEYAALGQGTQRIEEALKKNFANISIKRIDSYSTRLKGSMDDALTQAITGKAKILVGTQMISKGHHFPSLSLVAVINADQGLFSMDFRGSERLAQNLIQVSGRAGREEQKGQVLIQTEYPDHPFWGALFDGGYKEVAKQTIKEREEASWPPFSNLILIRASSHRKDFTWDFLNTANEIIVSNKFDGINILGPVSSPMEKKAGRFRGQLLLHCENRKPLHQQTALLFKKIERKKCTHRVKWSIDVDPIELF